MINRSLFIRYVGMETRASPDRRRTVVHSQTETVKFLLSTPSVMSFRSNAFKQNAPLSSAGVTSSHSTAVNHPPAPSADAQHTHTHTRRGVTGLNRPRVAAYGRHPQNKTTEILPLPVTSDLSAPAWQASKIQFSFHNKLKPATDCHVFQVQAVVTCDHDCVLDNKTFCVLLEGGR